MRIASDILFTLRYVLSVHVADFLRNRSGATAALSYNHRLKKLFLTHILRASQRILRFTALRLLCYYANSLTGLSPSRPSSTSSTEHTHYRMSFTVFLGNLPVWVTADDIKSWLSSESLVADAVKVIRNPETQESKGFAFIEAPNQDEMNSIIRRFDRAPLEDRLLRANPAQPPKGKAGLPIKPTTSTSSTVPDRARRPMASTGVIAAQRSAAVATKPTGNGNGRRSSSPAGQSAFAEELAKVL
jgi:RNA recognition motif-containing protein